jgi:hypothetical protein
MQPGVMFTGNTNKSTGFANVAGQSGFFNSNLSNVPPSNQFQQGGANQGFFGQSGMSTNKKINNEDVFS